MLGMQDAGIMACAKHFPGHGDTDTDSHLALPLLRQSAEEIDSLHLYPFRQLIDQGLKSVMVAHLQIPSLEPTPDLASTLSQKIVTGLLQEQMGFEGLVITDALDMKGVSKYFEPGELELKALLAGNDILLLPEDVKAAITTIREAIEQGDLSEETLNNKVRKILYHKQQVRLDKYQPVAPEGLVQYLNNPRALQLNKSMIHSAITLVRNEEEIIPVRNLANRRIASLSIGGQRGNAFQAMLDNYASIDPYWISKNHDPAHRAEILEALSGYDLVIVGVHDNSMQVSRRYGVDEPTVSLINELSARQQVIMSLFANPYSLDYFEQQVLDLKGIVVAYQEGKNYEEAAAQIIFGGLPARGRLPVSVPPYFPAYKSIHTPEGFRVRYADPEEVGLNSELLGRIDSLALYGIAQKAYPGCQIAVIRDGAVVYHKAFGYHTYDSVRAVTISDLYDLASVTKVVATTAAVMRLADEHKLDIEQNIGRYLPFLKNTNKENIRLREMLAHQGKLQAWIPFYMETLQDGMINPEIYHPGYAPDFSLPVAHDLFMKNNFRDTIYSRIIDSPLLKRNVYRYSDLGFIMLTDIVELQSGQPLNEFARDIFYKPLGLRTMTYLPLEHFPAERIVPSEVDTIFRRQLIKGYVNDPAAAMLGGVAGHAGLFSNAMDLAVFMQMILQNGEYGGTRFLNEATVREFTTVQFAGNQNRRGLGFDKPNIQPKEAMPAGLSASPFSYGHSGFTGTYTWVDPAENLVYVFLSNRTYPDPNNRKISELNIRTDIHQVIYDAIHVNRFAEKDRVADPDQPMPDDRTREHL